jgi:Periplasmic binding protein
MGVLRRWKEVRRPLGASAAAVIFVTCFACSGAGAQLSSSSDHAAVTPPDKSSTSSRGVVGNEINVVFPVANLSSLSGSFGFAGDPEDAEQTLAIKFYVNQINEAGGINRRKINPIIVSFDPANDANMQSLCQQWTQGNPPIFAVVDGIGTWTGVNQLCVTRQGHTPLISASTGTTNWTQEGSPYLWWTGSDQAPVLATTVQWGLSSGRLGHGKKIGIVVSDQTGDQDALRSNLLPDLKKAGITPQVVTVAGNPDQTATTNSDAQLAVERFKAAGVQSVIPLLPENAFFPYLSAETAQQYFPQLLLSDYASTIEVGLGLIPVPYEKALDGQEGVTVETLGGIDDDRPESQGGYDPGVRSCFYAFRKSERYPFPKPPSHPGPWIEEQGPIAGWCQAIGLFAAAAKKAGPNLSRRTFVEGMASIKNYPGTLSPILSYGTNKFYGPSQYRVVSLHNNSAADNQCIKTYTGKPQGTCWRVVQNWKPLVGS